MAYVETSNGQQPSVNVFPGNGNGNGGFGDMVSGGGIFFWLILFFFMMMFMGWGNNGNAAGNNGGVTYVPYAAPMMPGYGYQASCDCGNAIRNGFDQAAVVGGINGLQTMMQNGFNNAEVSRCNQQANLLATMNNNQNTMIGALNSQAMALQNCCCENRANVADLKYTVANEACADRNAINNALQAVTAQNNANTQRILDMMCQDKIDAKNEKIAELQTQLQMAQLAASQNAQTAAILTDNLAQTNNLEQYLAPVPRPAYIVQNPNSCSQNYNPCPCNGRC